MAIIGLRRELLQLSLACSGGRMRPLAAGR